MDAYGYYCRSEIIRLPDGNLIDFNGREDQSVVRELTDTARKYINDDYADFLQMFLDGLLRDVRLEEMRFNSDFDAAEEENEGYRATLNEIENTLQEYKTKVFDHKTKLYRKDLDAMLKCVHGLINEVI